MVDCAYVIGFNFPCCTSCFTRPGCATSAMSGGLPPAIAVDSTVGMSLPFDEYVTVTFGYCLWKPSITFWNAFCSVAAQMPQNLTDPDTLEFPVVVLLEPPPPPPPQPAATATSTATTPARAVIRTTRLLLRVSLTLTLLSGFRFRRRFLRSSPGRRSGATACRPRPRPAYPPRPRLARRSGRRRARPSRGSRAPPPRRGRPRPEPTPSRPRSKPPASPLL